jgi:hypothetical protein
MNELDRGSPVTEQACAYRDEQDAYPLPGTVGTRRTVMESWLPLASATFEEFLMSGFAEGP